MAVALLVALPGGALAKSGNPPQASVAKSKSCKKKRSKKARKRCTAKKRKRQAKALISGSDFDRGYSGDYTAEGERFRFCSDGTWAWRFDSMSIYGDETQSGGGTWKIKRAYPDEIDGVKYLIAVLSLKGNQGDKDYTGRSDWGVSSKTRKSWLDDDLDNIYTRFTRSNASGGC